MQSRIGRDFIEDILLQASRKIPGRYYFAIFILATTTLSYQILITRFFSVMLYYHFAFAAISLAMLGLTRGAMEVYGKPVRYAPERVGVEFASHAVRFAITGVGAMIAFLCVPLVVPSDYVMVLLGIATVAFVRPFTESGVCITLLLTRLPNSNGWLYAADLAGAALGCIGVILLLLVVDPVSATLLILEMTAAPGSWIRKAPFAAGLSPGNQPDFALCIRTSRVGGPTASRVNLWRLVPGTAWILVKSGYLRFVTSFSCLRAWWHMQTNLPRRPRSGRLRLMSSGKRDQKRARKAATVKITTPQESAAKPVITTADWPIERRSSNLVGP